MRATARSSKCSGPRTSGALAVRLPLDPKSLFAANELDDDGFEVGIYHSHPRSAAEPSQTDIILATYPHWTYLIVSLENGDAPVVRAWKIADGAVKEEELDVGS